MKIFITGGLGFVGSKIARSLADRGHSVFILDHMDSRIPPEVSDLEIMRADITQPSSLKKIDIRGVDAVLHLAAQSSGPKSFEIPGEDIKINLLGTLNVIDWLKDNKVKRLLFASSFVVYGDPSTESVTEDAPTNPKSVYAVSKLACEHLLKVYATPHGIQWNVLRMFNVYGPGQDLSRKDQGVVGIFLNTVKNSDIVAVKGSLDRFRDLVHIDDVVKAWTLCLEQNSYPETIYNVGSGQKTTFEQLIKRLIVSMDRNGKVKIEQAGSTPGDIMGVYADISKIKRDLGYSPSHDLNSGIDSMVTWVNSL